MTFRRTTAFCLHCRKAIYLQRDTQYDTAFWVHMNGVQKCEDFENNAELHRLPPHWKKVTG